MTSIPSNLARVPNLLSSQIMLASLNKTNQQLLDLQVQLASGKAVNRASDDAVAASTISVLDDSIKQRDQRVRNLSHAEAVLNNLDAALADTSNLLLEAKGIGLSQIGIGSDATTRKNQAEVIDAILNQMIDIANRDYQDVHFFAGNATANPPMEDLLGGVRYLGEGDGLTTDLGAARSIPITVGAEDAFGSLSSRVEGDRDLDPGMVGATRLSDLNGARGLGITFGSINVDVNGADLTVDLSGAHTVQDVIDTLQTEIQTIDAGAVVQIDAATGNRLQIIPSGGVTVTIADLGAGTVAQDLGIDGVFPPGGGTGNDLDPHLTMETLVTSLSGVTTPLGTIRLENAGQMRDVDLSGAQTVEDIANAIHALNLGVRVEIADSGDRINMVNELSGALMSIGEVGGVTATELGVRSLAGTTRLDDFNDGLGVQIRTGSVDPVTGLPDPAADEDFEVTTKDGTTFQVDLAGAETVQDVLDTINAAAAGAGLTIGTGPGEFAASLVTTGNGIAITDNTVGGSPTSVVSLNGSYAAKDLGIVGSTTGATLAGEDRAKVAVDSVFSHLIALRDALQADDERGISLATDRLEADLLRATETRATVGVRSRRVTDATAREGELRIQDVSLRSEAQDLDFTEAAIRFSTLQQQLQAGLATAGRIGSVSLLDFLR